MEQATYEENKLELITINDFNVICRFCLDRIGKLTPIFKHESSKNNNAENNENIPSQIKSCLGIEINIDDGLPIFICCDCQNQLNQCNNFRQRCISSIETLQHILSRHEESQYYNNYFDPVTDEQPIDNDNDLINEPIDQNTDEDNKLEITSNFKEEKQQEEEKFYNDNKSFENENIVIKAKSKSKKLQQQLRKRGRPKNDNSDRLNSARLKNRPEMCEICGTMQTNIKIHLLIHDSVKAIECAYCGKKFAQKYSLHSHFKIHINERPHQCPICPYKFHQAAHLRRHMCTHTGEKRFKCDMCPRQFAQSGTLNEHRLAHTQNRQVPCPYCDKMFLTKKALRSHVGIHTGERPFKCEVCGLSYVSSSSLSAHRRIHKRENPTIQCELCPQVFESRTMWRSHVRDHGLNTLSTHLKVFVK